MRSRRTARLVDEGIRSRVVSMPCWELFEQQPQSYRDTVLPPTVRARVSIEAAAPFGWERYVGLEGAIIGVTDFGASAPGPVVMRRVWLHAGATRRDCEEDPETLISVLRGSLASPLFECDSEFNAVRALNGAEDPVGHAAALMAELRDHDQ